MSDDCPIGSFWEHLKTGHVYVVLFDCCIEASSTRAIAYRIAGCPDANTVWVRPRDEFLDGRFKRLG